MAKYIRHDSRVQNLEFSKAWTFLSEKERNYAYYLSKASWAGCLVVLHQICYEQVPLFLLFQSYFQSKDFDELEDRALAAGVSASDWKNFIAYVGGFYGNLSNYHSFGHMKFVPDCQPAAVRAIFHSHPEYEKEGSLFRKTFDELFPQCEMEIFQYDGPYKQINFPSEGGVTAYFSRNMTKEDLEACKSFMASQKLDPLNTRAFKTGASEYLITVGSISEEGSGSFEFQGSTFTIQYGEFAPYLVEMNKYLKKALEYVANDNQKRMIEKYIEHYETGSIDTHKDSQRAWIADKKPVVESNMGWIETYIDPTNERAYFEGWVAIVDKEKSAKFQKLVENSERVIPQLPWPSHMEKDKFLAPDFTTLEIISFATNSCPLGINIPNYDDIRQEEGFKNVFLNNSLGSYTASTVQFASDEQSKILSEYTLRSYEVHVACHELLGHGVGKLIYRGADGECPSFTDPVNGETFESCYEEGETWNGKFGAISTSYEECRADACGFYLCTLPDVYTLFNWKEDELDTLLWVNVMNQFRKGILGLQLFNTETKKWGQAHTQGAYVFSQFMLQNQKSDIAKIELCEGGQDFRIHLNKENLMTEGRELISKFLVILQTYKSSGAFERAKKFYDHYSKVEGDLLTVREVVIAHKKARRVELNNNLVRYNEKVIEPVVYPETFEGIVASYVDRYPVTEDFFKTVLDQWNPTKKYLRI